MPKQAAGTHLTAGLDTRGDVSQLSGGSIDQGPCPPPPSCSAEPTIGNTLSCQEDPGLNFERTNVPPPPLDQTPHKGKRRRPSAARRPLDKDALPDRTDVPLIDVPHEERLVAAHGAPRPTADPGDTCGGLPQGATPAVSGSCVSILHPSGK